MANFRLKNTIIASLKLFFLLYPILCSILYASLQLSAMLFNTDIDLSLLINLLFVIMIVYGIAYIGFAFGLLPSISQHHFKLVLLAITFFSLIFLLNISIFLTLSFLIMSIGFSFITILAPRFLLSNAYVPLSLSLITHQLYQSRSLIFIWFNNTIRARYIQTTLGMLWIILLPLAQSLVIAFALTQLLKVRSIGTPWVVFLLSGRVIFGIFQSIVLLSSASLISNNELIKRVYFPREIIIILIVGEVLVDFLLQFVALLIICWLFALPPNIYYLFLPIPIIIMTLLSTGIGLIVSWLSLIIRDFRPLLTIGLQLLMYLTIFYAKRAPGEKLEIMLIINPLLTVTEAFRDIIIYNQVPNFGQLLITFFVSLAIFYPGYILFKVNEDRFADYS
jgi:lipopolysaccharide transport system permease protein